MEHDAVHLLMKRLEILYNISMNNSDIILGKEMELLKKQIDQLHQPGARHHGYYLSPRLENEASNESTKKTIFGVNEGDLGNYDTDFIDLRKPKVEGTYNDDGGEEARAKRKLPKASANMGELAKGGSPTHSSTSSSPQTADNVWGTSVVPNPDAAKPVIKHNGDATNRTGSFPTKRGNFNDGFPSEFFKKVLNDVSLQKEYDSFQHILYGFARRHSYLRGERMNLTNAYRNLFVTALSLRDTLEAN
ncbi:hypothetical protein C922_01842 [Plasmodium inui San Antonio 1]|uniref:Merozoite surface protein C-terminal domain-containing protein n=1 Tax=Plasmodium inui San Antonio 1 TaxID=1237626 RepID=W7A350_9APIC|nr:hypothetical protein C922_01842 [Plasmodium inui San Antonio 1]EUD67657.1 hypothetical protein C922_01842 [Plasmodium inui San Antonio 1]